MDNPHVSWEIALSMVIFHSYVKLPGGNDSVLRYREWLEDVWTTQSGWISQSLELHMLVTTQQIQRNPTDSWLHQSQPSSPKSVLVSTYIHRVSFLPKNRNNKKQPWPILGILIILQIKNQPLSLFPYSGFSSLLLWGLWGAPRAVPDTNPLLILDHLLRKTYW
jgi:hypothetical protein